jgi:hypothetical protein
MFRWYKELRGDEKRTFWACFGGWATDALDVQTYSFVIPALISLWNLSKSEAGLWARYGRCVPVACRCLIGFPAAQSSDRNLRDYSLCHGDYGRIDSAGNKGTRSQTGDLTTQ